MGIHAAGAANYAMDKVAGAYGATMSKVARMRQQLRDGETIDNAFTEEERKRMT